MHVERNSFGKVDGKPVAIYTLENANGLVAKITTYGAILTELKIPDRDGKKVDVTLGCDSLEGYLEKHPYFGSMVGRVANRIAKGQFTLDGKTYQLATNNGPNHLHGGLRGFDKKVWDASLVSSAEGPSLKLTTKSPDGEEGYPGNLLVTVVYTLTQENELKLRITAETDKPTPVNIAHHSYWNLAGHASGTILDHEVMLNADNYTPTDATLIPTGQIAPVAGTPYDFRQPKPIGRDIAQIPADPAAGNPGGYDVNFVLNGELGEMKLAARVRDLKSGRVMEVWTTEPGVQFYTGNFLDGTKRGKGGVVYNKHAGFCLETQHFPDSVNKPDWPSVILRPGETYVHEMVHKFSAE
ncbi:MAG: aldose epimerase family protein [Planctomycetota bacterium]